MKRACILYAFCLPADSLGALVALVLAPFQARARMCFERRPTGVGLWALTLDVVKLPGTRRALVVAPHVVFFRSGCHFGQGWSVLQERSHKRSELCEAVGVMSFAIALLGLALGMPWWAALAVWAPAPWLFMLASALVTWLRGSEVRVAHVDDASHVLSAEVSKR